MVVEGFDQELSNVSYFDSVLHKIAEEFDEEEDDDEELEQWFKLSGVGVERAVWTIEGDTEDDEEDEEEEEDDKDNGWLFK